VCSFLPALGLLTGLLPKIDEKLMPRGGVEPDA
jgi:hypothetical protein